MGSARLCQTCSKIFYVILTSLTSIKLFLPCVWWAWISYLCLTLMLMDPPLISQGCITVSALYTLSLHALITNLSASLSCLQSAHSILSVHPPPPSTNIRLAKNEKKCSSAVARMTGNKIKVSITKSFLSIKYTIQSIVCEASSHPVIRSLNHSVT